MQRLTGPRLQPLRTTSPRRISSWRTTTAADWVLPALAVAMAVSAALLLWEGRHMTFFNDEWDLLLHRRGHDPAIFLRAKNGHLILFPLLIDKVLLAIFGASYTPFRVVSVASGLICAGVAFVLIRRRVGEVPALLAAILLLFLGVAWEQLFWAIGITYYLSLAAGMGMLIALERRDRKGDIAAALLLVVSLGSFSFGVAFAIAAAVEVALRSRELGWRRLWIAIGPLVLYGLWAIGWAESEALSSNIASTPFYLAETASAAMASLTGLFRMVGTAPGSVTGFPPFNIEYGQPLAVAGVVVLLLRLARGPLPTPRLWTLVILTLALWVGLALVAGPGRSPGASRYQYPDVLLVLLIAAELLLARRASLQGGLLLACVLAFALIANIANLRDGARFFTEQSQINRAELAALEISRPIVAPTFVVEGSDSYPPAQGHYLQFVDARSYFSFTASFGSPADSVVELEHGPEIAREAADIVLARAERMTPVIVPSAKVAAGPLAVEPGTQAASIVRHGGCLELRAGSAPASLAITLPQGGLLVQSADAPVEVRLRRFAEAFSAVAGAVAPSTQVVLVPHPDRAPRPWRAIVTATSGRFAACPLASQP